MRLVILAAFKFTAFCCVINNRWKRFTIHTIHLLFFCSMQCFRLIWSSEIFGSFKLWFETIKEWRKNVILWLKLITQNFSTLNTLIQLMHLFAHFSLSLFLIIWFSFPFLCSLFKSLYRIRMKSIFFWIEWQFMIR